MAYFVLSRNGEELFNNVTTYRVKDSFLVTCPDIQTNIPKCNIIALFSRSEGTTMQYAYLDSALFGLPPGILSPPVKKKSMPDLP